MEAVNDAHPVAFPTLHKALAANPGARRDASHTIRYRHDPIMRGVADARVTLASSLGAVVGDVRQMAGVNALTQQAGGA